MSTRISDLPSAPTVTSADLVPIVQNGVTKKATAGTVVSNLLPVASTSQPGIVQLGTGGSNACQGNDARLSNSRAPSGSAGGDLTGTYPNPELIALCTAGTYGSTSAIPVLTLDSKGRVASIETSQIFVNGNNITSGTISADRIRAVTGDVLIPQGSSVSALQTTGVSAGTFGSAAVVPRITVDSKGRIISATNVGISGSAGGTVVSVGATSSTLAISNSPVTYSGALQLELSTTGVPAITAGSSTQSAVITVDSYGRVTALETQSIAALSPSGVTAGTYGQGNSVGRFSVNANGVITGASQQIISIGASQVLSGLTSAQISGLSASQVGAGITSAQVAGLSASQVGTGITSAQITGISAAQVASGLTPSQISGLAPSATTDTTNASNITSGVLSASRFPNSGVVAAAYGSATAIPVLSIDASGRVTSASTSQITAIPTTVGYLREITNPVASSATGVINFDILTQPTLFYTANSSAAFTLNIRGDSGTTFNSIASTGQAVTVTFLNTNGSFAAPLSAVQVDGVAQSVKWQNGTGSIPSPNSSAIDAWTITVIKTASNTYTVIGALNKFA